MNDLPNFASWSNEDSVKFAEKSYLNLQYQQEQLERLQRHLKGTADMAKAMRELLAPWND